MDLKKLVIIEFSAPVQLEIRLITRLFGIANRGACCIVSGTYPVISRLYETATPSHLHLHLSTAPRASVGGHSVPWLTQTYRLVNGVPR
jgi:hypothetical protein